MPKVWSLSHGKTIGLFASMWQAVFWLGMLSAFQSAYGIVNPALQPIELADRYNAVVGCEIVRIDGSVMTARITRVCKGAYDGKDVEVALQDIPPELRMLLQQGQTMVAFAGKARRGHENDLLVYAGNGFWQDGTMQSPSRWQLSGSADDQDAEINMSGTFNGRPERLVEMMSDAAAGRAYFPAQPFIQFKDDLVIGILDKPIGGVALYDIDGDGLLDIHACSASGNRVWLQTAPLKFEDRTQALGLEEIASPGCSWADVNGDGHADLLAGGVLHLGGAKGFTKSKLLPAEAASDVRSAAFVEINGDRLPDVIISRINGGLTAWLNPGDGLSFENATEKLTLPTTGDGFFAPGDWNDDGRTDLFYGVEKGVLLVQGGDGKFAPVPHQAALRCTPEDNSTGRTAAGAFGAILHSAKPSLIIPQDSDHALLAPVDGAVKDFARFANEMNENTFSQLGTIAEDLNADGYVDLFTISRAPEHPSRLHMNRGYGSFLRPDKYKHALFPGPAVAHGAGGVAAGDVNGDGANDLLIGGLDGKVTLIVNDSLSERVARERASYHEKKLIETKIIAVKLAGAIGTLGAKVSVAPRGGEPLAVRWIGGNVITGCCSPAATNIAIREPGSYVVSVRFSDGHEEKWNVDLPKDSPRVRPLEARRK